MQASSDPGQGEGWGKEGKEKRGEIRASLLCFSGARLPHIFGRLESLEHNTVSYPYSQNLQDLRLPSALFLPGVPRVPLNRLSVKWTEENGGGAHNGGYQCYTYRLKGEDARLHPTVNPPLSIQDQSCQIKLSIFPDLSYWGSAVKSTCYS